ncbi:hypothetical protein ACQCX5_10055 [Propionibacteriaceae bacterium G57]|uniref:hypothetical protein n=1 Tax=Aestuariimicrobium sp. G57 TaxID=3418485 RepID=UPI003DA7508A
MSNDDQPDVDQRFRDIISDFVDAHPQLVTGRIEGLMLPAADPTLQHADAGVAGSLKQRIDHTHGHRRTILMTPDAGSVARGRHLGLGRGDVVTRTAQVGRHVMRPAAALHVGVQRLGDSLAQFGLGLGDPDGIGRG